MKRSLFFSSSLPAVAAFVSLAVPALALPPAAPASPPLPPLPGSQAASKDAASADAPATPPSGDSQAPNLSPQQIYEHIRRGVVALERNGVPLAIGTILDGDGRILTSLSGLGGVDTTDVRYADGTTAHAKVGNADKVTDLALLVPQSSKWTEGLSASEADPIGAPLRAMLPGHGPKLGPAEAGVKGHVEAHARDGAALLPVLDIDVKGPLVVGAPLLDAAGGVVAILVRACKGAAASASQQEALPWAAWAAAQEAAPKPVTCTPIVVGAPVATIRSFLAKTPATAVAPTPWLGIRGERAQAGAVSGVRIVAIAPASPAQKAGLRPDADLIVAAEGHPVDSPESLADAIGKHAPGETVKLLVFGDEKFREVSVALKAAP